MLRRLLTTTAAAFVLAATCCACAGRHPGNDETDRIAQVVSDAISWPRHDSAIGYARAAADTTAAKDGRLTIVGVEELEAEDVEDPFARLTYRIHLEGSLGGFIETDPVTACYVAEFDLYGVAGAPDRIGCPADAEPVAITTPDPTPVAKVPAGFERTVRRALVALPGRPEQRRLTDDLVAALDTDPGSPAPQVDTVVDGTDAGVAVRGDDDCLLGARVSGKVEVWSPSSVQLQPGELTCDAFTALAQQGQHAPH